MLRGLDTTFLVEAEVTEHPGHKPARTRLDQALAEGDTLALAPQVLAEFVHIVTDPKRFTEPLTMQQAIDRARLWWHATEVRHALPSNESLLLAIDWQETHRLGRKRILDTQLAATYHCNGVRSILSTNIRDFKVFGCFEVIVP